MAHISSLRTLLAACGVTLAPNQNWRSYVPGATDNNDLAGYLATAFGAITSPDYSAAVATGTTIHLDWLGWGAQWVAAFGGSSPYGIIGCGTDIPADPAGRDAVITGGSWTGGAGGGPRVNVLLTGRGMNGTYSGGLGSASLVRNYYTEYDPPDYPLGVGSGGSAEWQMLMNTAAGSYSPPSLAADSFNVVLGRGQSAPAPGGDYFNDAASASFPVAVNQYDAGPPTLPPLLVEWYTDDSFTTLLATGPDYRFMVDSSNWTGYVSARWRHYVTDAWTPYAGNPIHYHDPRVA